MTSVNVTIEEAQPINVSLGDSQPINVSLVQADITGALSITDTSTVDLTLDAFTLSADVIQGGISHDNLIAGTIASHDTSATGSQLDTLTDNSIADALHRHSELVASDGSPDPALSVDATGNVGIGTTSPGELLELNSGSGSDTIMVLKGVAGQADTKKIRFQASGSIQAEIEVADNASNLLFHTNDVERMRIGSTGNVGIGTTNPAAKLEVNGTSILDGDVRIGDSVSTPEDLDIGYTTISSSSGTLTFDNPFAFRTLFQSNQDAQLVEFIGVTNEGKEAGFVHYDVNNAKGRLLDIFSQPGVDISFSPAESEAIRILASNGNVGINITNPSTLLHIDQSSTTAALPVVTIDQADVDEPFMKLIGTAAAATLTNSIVAEADVTTATRAGFVKVEVQDDGNQITDQDYFMPVYTLA